jgi:Zn-dependent M32 family carboxypeptidase
MSGAASNAHEAWVHARANSNFAEFVPALEQGLELRRRYVDCFEGPRTRSGSGECGGK